MNQNLRVLPMAAKSPEQKTFIELFREFNHQDGIENAHSAKTLYKYENFATNFSAFLTAVNRDGLQCSEMNIATLKEFVLWLRDSLRSCDRTHLAKHVSRINKALDYAVDLGIIPFNSCRSYRLKRGKNKAIIRLEDSEFLKWTCATWHNTVYQQAQDLYSFQMVTGLSYGDLFSYVTVKDPGTGIWIEGTRSKTGKPFAIPLFHADFSLALELHEKYSGKLPRLENHVYNRYIREMAAVLGIEKYISSHVGRKTFANRMHQAGRSLGFIGAAMGNTDKVLLTHYIGFSRDRILNELKKGA